MKNENKLFKIITITTLLTTSYSSFAQMEHNHSSMKKMNDMSGMEHNHSTMSEDVNNDENSVYVCPMHPEIVTNAPGLCPLCNMKLEKVSFDEE